MKKVEIIQKKKVPNVKALFLGVLVLVIFISIYLTFFPSISLSPEEEQSATSFVDASSFLSKLGQDGIDWYCGKRESFTDEQGNNYGAKELEALKKILGNERRLMEEFC